MSAKYTRTGLDADAEQSLTDWDRLRELGDEEIDAAIAADESSYAIADGDRIGRVGAGYRYVVFRGEAGWQWRLVDSAGTILAESHGGFRTRRSAELALVSLRQALLGAAA